MRVVTFLCVIGVASGFKFLSQVRIHLDCTLVSCYWAPAALYPSILLDLTCPGAGDGIYTKTTSRISSA